MYESSVSGSAQLKYVTLIREIKTEGDQFGEPKMTPAQIQGHWKGCLSALHATMAPATTGSSQWELNQASLNCRDEFGENAQTLKLSLEQNDSDQIVLLKGELEYRLMALPSGTYCLVPSEINRATEFRIEVGWLREGERSRLIRYYDNRGVWVHSALIEDSLQD
jgi:hypothetical protein